MIEVIIIIGICVTGFGGYRHKSLTKSGALTAIIVGAAVYAGFGIKGLVLLGTFFATSNFWSKYKSSVKQPIEEKLAKGATRDWRQVIANGGAAGLFSIIHYFEPDLIWLIGFVVSLASANSDTWASEIGSLSRKNPIYIRTFKRVEKGTSGAISSFGSAAALAGAFLISITSFFLFDLDGRLTLFVFLFGYFGNVIDTIMGAYYQQMYVCQHCGIETEKRQHCQLPTTRIKGYTLVDNDMVNFLSGFLAAIAAIGLVLVSK
ncbi:DUF92 domain-containing protein [Neobacillus sp. OS1-2]|uniref:DUF92 domain-containing protein n=1 Tax=Neobacillus sp. OS1-2 TaxID=3070680 RepID=UPI0027DF316D|nr:DUF92 domain-containing protein [Neobacillus sp. OS1-2]WML40559.1 DUF92 domain-containing protein [Neobacillus sp. OS1-2]